jgi:hypothetical protein
LFSRSIKKASFFFFLFFFQRKGGGFYERFPPKFQIENEYGNIDSSYGPAAKSYINWAASMAVSLDTGVPWVMCQQADAPDPIVSLFYFVAYRQTHCMCMFVENNQT